MTEAEAQAYNAAIDDMTDIVTAATAAIRRTGTTKQARSVGKALTAFVAAAEIMRRKAQTDLLEPTLETPSEASAS